ncbi:hypothetical protein OROGR_026263 [Orobanche gracilis]
MQGHRSSLTTLSENLGFDHGSTSSEPAMDSQMSWNNIQTSTQNRIPGCIISSTTTNTQYLHPVSHEGLNADWTLGETSSTATHGHGENNDRKGEHTWTICPRSSLTLDRPRHEPSDIILSDNNTDVTANISQAANTYTSIGSSTEQTPPSIGSSSDLPSECLMEASENGLGRSLEGRRISCKRKSLEVHAGQSSNAERSNISSTSTPAENGPVIDNGPVPTNPRFRLGVGGPPPLGANPFSPVLESARRNFRLRINGSRYQDHHITNNLFLPGPDPVSVDIPSSQSSPSLTLRNHLFDLNPPPAVENWSLRGQSGLLHVPSVPRNTQSRWGGTISSRMSNSSIPGERDPMLHDYEESTPRNIPRSISEHPMFVPASEIGSLSPQPPTNWNLDSGNNIDNNINININRNNNAGNVESSSQTGSGLWMNSSGPSWANRSRPQYSRRLSEIVRRSLLPTAGVESSRGQSNSRAVRSGSSGSSNHGRHLLASRSALSERQHVDGALGLPYSLRNLAAAGGGEGRTSLTSENNRNQARDSEKALEYKNSTSDLKPGSHIRHVLDLMRRGEGLRFEELMILDHSVFFGMSDIHDPYHDRMRLDIDNMSYEELLALEERIGTVCTGLNEGTIMSRLKQHKYINLVAQNQAEPEPCCICREEYNDGEDLGTLECGHGFHRDCIKQWLTHKNLCPICKTTGLTA